MKKSLLLLIPALFLIASCGDKNEEPAAPRHEHIFSTEWKFDGTSHFHGCDCGEKKDAENHIDGNNDHLCDVCGFKIPVPPCPDGQHVNANIDEDMICDICGYPIEYKHAKSVSGDPTAPFFLKVGEEKEIKATLEPTPERAVEKIFTWKSSNDAIASVEVDPSNTAKAKIVGKKAGKVTFTATNTYNPATLFRKFEATVVDFNEDNMNLWEYKSEDKSQFGYTSDNKQGVASGTAVLNGLSWEFTRSAAISLNLTKGGMLGFGKGGDPETLVKLVNHNLRKVKSVSIETCSANGLAALTVKVGDTTVIEGSTPSSNKDYIPAMSSGDLDSLAGDISIQFDTPAMDPTRVEDETYIKPGSVYIKSIWIIYAEEEIEYKTVKTYDFASMYADTESDFYKSLKSTAGPQTYEDDDYVISFAKIGKTNTEETLAGYAKTNSDIEIKIKNTEEVIKSVTFEYQSGGTANQYSVLSSNLGGAPYLNYDGSGNDSKVTAIIPESNINAIQLQPSKNNYVAVISITIKTIEGKHAVIDSVAFADDAKPTKVEYSDGETFDPTGLGTATVKFTNSEIAVVELPETAFEYYDGPSYDEPADHSAKKTALSEGTTYVYAVYKGFEIKIEGLTVELQLMSLDLVKDLNDITDTDEYFITSPSNKAFTLGSSGSSITSGAGCQIISDLSFGDTLSLSMLYKDDSFNILKNTENGLYTLKSVKTDYMYGVTDKPASSTAKEPKNHEWAISINSETGIATISIGPISETTMWLGFNNKIIKPQTSDMANIAIYKLTK